MKNDGRIPIKATIYHVADGRMAVKAYANVIIGDYLAINSFSIAFSSSENELVVYPPSVKCGGKAMNGKKERYKKIVEFPHWEYGRLKDVIDRLCIFAYRRYEDDHNTLGQYCEPAYIGIEDLTGFDENKIKDSQESIDAIELGDIPF